uniref:GDNF/GAS1 domain-containing protein n=1 Tax=Gasterosteus aculeatus TaxID=69293 RepID=G3QBU3_GASAC
NQCLKAAQDCGLYEKCGSLRSEYVVACTKRSTASDNACNRQKCHRALRRFLERVPEEYSFGLLFCPCSDTLCGERRRKTIVPSCSYEENGRGEERVGKPNCLSLQNYCSRDELCRSRFADFQHNCQPSPVSASGCVRDSRAMCLKAYAGLIGTIMTPNYVSNSSTDVSQWCTCDGSGNEWQACQRILHLFSSNTCLQSYYELLQNGGKKGCVLQIEWQSYQDCGCNFLSSSNPSLLVVLILLLIS